MNRQVPRAGGRDLPAVRVAVDEPRGAERARRRRRAPSRRSGSGRARARTDDRPSRTRASTCVGPESVTRARAPLVTRPRAERPRWERSPATIRPEDQAIHVETGRRAPSRAHEMTARGERERLPVARGEVEPSTRLGRRDPTGDPYVERGAVNRHQVGAARARDLGGRCRYRNSVQTSLGDRDGERDGSVRRRVRGGHRTDVVDHETQMRSGDGREPDGHAPRGTRRGVGERRHVDHLGRCAVDLEPEPRRHGVPPVGDHPEIQAVDRDRRVEGHIERLSDLVNQRTHRRDPCGVRVVVERARRAGCRVTPEMSRRREHRAGGSGAEDVVERRIRCIRVDRARARSP